jgi:hypothetical protein
MQANGGNTSGLSSFILGMVVLALAGTIGTIGLLREVAAFRPGVGDIVSFDPLDALSRDMHAKIDAARANDRPGAAACVLDVAAIHAAGGSVVIEARLPQTGGYRVHWAGARSSDDPADCGASADLLLSQEDIEVQAMAAGGYGVSPRKTLLARAL